MSGATRKGSKQLRILNFKHGALNGELGSKYQYRVNEYEATEQGFNKSAAAETFKTDILEGLGPLIGTVIKDVTAEGATESDGMDTQPIKHQRLRVRIPEIHSHIPEPAHPDDDFFINQHNPVFVAANNVPRAQVNDIVLVQVRSAQNMEGGVYVQNYTRTGDNDPNADAFSRTVGGLTEAKEWCKKKPTKKLNMDLAKTIGFAKGILRPAADADSSCLIIGDSHIDGPLGDILESYMAYYGWRVLKYGSKQFDFYGIRKPLSEAQYKVDFEKFLVRAERAVAVKPAPKLIFLSLGVLLNAGEKKTEAAGTTPASTPAPAPAAGTGGGGTAVAAAKKPVTAPGGREVAAIEDDFKRILSTLRSSNSNATIVWFSPPPLIGAKGEFTAQNITAGKSSIVKDIVDQHKKILKADENLWKGGAGKTIYLDNVNSSTLPSGEADPAMGGTGIELFFRSYGGVVKTPKGSNGFNMNRSAAKDFIISLADNSMGGKLALESDPGGRGRGLGKKVKKTTAKAGSTNTNPVTMPDVQANFNKAKAESEDEATRRDGITKLYALAAKGSKTSIAVDALDAIKVALTAWVGPQKKDKALYENYLKYRFEEKEEVKELAKTKLGIDINVYKGRVFHLECKTIQRQRDTATLGEANELTEVKTSLKNVFGADIRGASKKKATFKQMQERMVEAGIPSGPTNFFLKAGKKVPAGCTVYHWPYPGQNGRGKRLYGKKTKAFKGAVLHNDTGWSSKGCWNTLYARGLSSHFIVSAGGRIYQTADLDVRCHHAPGWNASHIGIDVQNHVSYSDSKGGLTGVFPNKGGERRMKKLAGKRRPLHHFQNLLKGREVKKYSGKERAYVIGSPTAQVSATHKLLKGLAVALKGDGFNYKIEPTGKRGFKGWNGIIAHYQFDNNRGDGSTMMELLRQKKKMVTKTPGEVLTAREQNQQLGNPRTVSQGLQAAMGIPIGTP